MFLKNPHQHLAGCTFIIVDDYGALPNCKAAIDEFRAKYSIGSPITKIDWTGVYWRK